MEVKPEPRRSFSLRMRRASSSKSVNEMGDESSSSVAVEEVTKNVLMKVPQPEPSPKSPKKKRNSFPRIGGLVRRLSGHNPYKDIHIERKGVNASFDAEEISDPSEKSIHNVNLNLFDNDDDYIKNEEKVDKAVRAIAPEKKALDVVVLVIDPKTHHFEIVLLEFFENDFHVSDLLGRIPACVVEEDLRQLKFDGVCDLNAKVFSHDALMTDVCPSGRDFLVAIPKGVAVSVCSKQGRIVLNDKEVLHMLESTGIDVVPYINLP